MTLSDLSIKRPVLATVFSLVIMLFGAIAFYKLPVREYPDIDPPIVTVTTVYTGANSKVIESEITDVIEEELSSVEGIRTITSASRDQVSTITVEFNLDRDIDIGAQDVRDKISRIQARLPDNSESPVIAKADSDAQPIMWVRVESDKRSLIELADYVEREIKDEFQTISGVSKVIFGGERKKSIQVLINPKKLAALGLTVLDVESALRDNNIELPAGRVLSKTKEFTINVAAKLISAEQYKDLILKSGRSVIRLRDVANVIEGPENDRSFVRFNGQKGFGLGVLRQPKSNTVLISKEVNKKIAELNKKIPDDIRLNIGYDAGIFIEQSIKEVYKTIVFASLLVLFIIFVFLRNIRTTLIPAVSIPVSLIGVMMVILALSFTVNLMTLLGLIIAIGIVVDDSIIVLENIYRYLEQGLDPKEAARRGANEITGAVIATTLVLVSIFLPITFIKGITGRLLSEFAVAISCATIISSFVALTLVPMLCSKFLTADMLQQLDTKSKKNQAKEFLKQLFSKVENFYHSIITRVLDKRKVVVVATLFVCAIASCQLFKMLPKDFIPKEDRGSFFTIFETPKGSSIGYLDAQIRKAENMLLKIPEVETIISVAAFGRDAPGKVTQGILINRLVDWNERGRNVFAIASPLFEKFAEQIPEAFVIPIFPSSGPSNGFGSQPIQLVLKSSDLDFLVEISDAIAKRAFALPSIRFARSNLSLDKPELDIEIKRDKALQLGVAMKDISETMEILFGGIDITEFNDRGENYKVIVQVPREERENPRKLGELAVRGDQGLVQLSNLISIKETVTAEEFSHHDRKRSVTIDASPKSGFTPSQGLDDIENLALKIIEEFKEKGNSPKDLELDYLGNSKELKDANSALYFGFVIAIILAYLFLAGQFESFIYPAIIMLSVPLAITGALLGLYFFKLFPIFTNILIDNFGAPMFLQYMIPQFKNISLNVYSQIGIIMLIGMASKNGILLVEFINQLRNQGLPLMEAVAKASSMRLRPILMTAFSTILGIMPIAIAAGIGAQSRQSMGIAVVAGMAFSTVLTLLVIPCAYTIISKAEEKSK